MDVVHRLQVDPRRPLTSLYLAPSKFGGQLAQDCFDVDAGTDTLSCVLGGARVGEGSRQCKLSKSMERHTPFLVHSISWIEKAQKSISGNLPFLAQSIFPLFRQNRQTNRLVILSTFLGKPTGWCYVSVFSFENVQTWSLHALSPRTSNKPLDARGRVQAEAGLLLGLARGQAGVEINFALR